VRGSRRRHGYKGAGHGGVLQGRETRAQGWRRSEEGYEQGGDAGKKGGVAGSWASAALPRGGQQEGKTAAAGGGAGEKGNRSV
jgi:hypothetical protein